MSNASAYQFIPYPPTDSTSGGGTGTVTSVAQTVPTAEFAVSGSPVTTSGTLAITKQTQAANLVWAGPVSGAAAQPTFRALTPADVVNVISWPYGTGADGSLVLDGVIAAPSGMSKSGLVYTMTRNQSFVDLTVNATVTLDTGSYAIFGTGTLTVNGAISRRGGQGSSSSGSGGVAVLAGYFNGAGGGGLGGAAAGNGGAGTAQANSLGGSGGNGGASGGRAGGLGGVASTPTEAIGGLSFCYTIFCIQSGRIAAGGTLNGGAGGGGGAGDGTGAGGGGSAGGGTIGLYFRTIAAGIGSITVKGADGVLPNVAAVNGPGSGGGGGGCVFLITSTSSYASLVTFDVSGGAGGAGRGTGVSGNAGGSGRVLSFITS